MGNERTVKIKILGDANGTPKIIEKEYRSMFAAIRREAEQTTSAFKSSFSSSRTIGGAQPSGHDNLIRDEIRAQKDLLALQSAQERAGRASQQTKQAGLAVQREEIKLLREKQRLENQTVGGQKRTASGNDAAFVRAFNTQSRAAQAEIKRFQASSIQAEKELTRSIEREAKAQASIKISEARRANVEQIRELKQFESEQKRLNSAPRGSLQNTAVGSFVGNVGATAVSELTSDFLSGAKAVFAYTASLEQARIGFTTLTGSAANADAHIRELQDFAKKTPFDFGGLVKASQLLQGVGIDSQRIIPILSDVGNALSAAGKGNEEIQRTVLALSQIASKGKLAGQEINQLAENGISAVSILAQATGKTRQEIIQLSEDGRISTDLFLQSLHKVVEARGLGDAMEKQSHTFNGAISNISDALFQFSEGAFRPLFNKFGHLADDLAQEISKQDADFNSIGKAIGTAISAGLGVVISSATISIGEQLKKEFGIIVEDIRTGQGLRSLSSPASFGAGLEKDTAAGFGYQPKPIFSLLGSSVVDKYNGQLKADAQTRRLLEKIENEKKYSELYDTQRRNTQFNKFANLNSGRPLVPEGAIIIKQDAKSIQYLDKVTNTIKTIAAEARKVPSLDEQLLPKKAKKTGGKDPFVEIQDYIKSAGFKPGSAYRPGGPNGPTDHAGRGAVDTSVAANPGKGIDDYTRLIIGALDRGKQVIDERVVGYFKGIKSSGPNVHIGNGRKGSLFLPQSFYSVPVDYLKQLDAKRGSRRGIDSDTGQITKDFNEKIGRELEDQSNKLTKDAQDKIIQRSIDAYKIAGLIPTGEILDKIQNKLSDEAKKGGKIQLTKEEVANAFLTNAQNKAGVLTNAPSAGLDQAITSPPTADDAYLANLKEQLNIRQNIEDLIFKTNNYEETVGLRTQAAIHRQAIDLRDTEIEYETIARQNSDDEFVAKRRQLSALQEIVSLTQQYAQLTDDAANASNAELNVDRQRNRFLAETNDLIRQRQDLEAELSGGERNQGLQIQIALYQDLINLRGRDTQAIIEQNKAEIELADAGTFHVEQLRANVLSHLAQQKTLTETLSDSIIGIYDKLGAASDKFLDKSVGKIPILGDLAKNFARQGLSSLTHGLLDQFFPGLGGTAAKTGNPQVDAINTSNDYLKSIDAKLGATSFGGILPGGAGGAGGAASGGGGILGTVSGFFNKLLHPGSSSTSGGGSSAGRGISGFLGSLFGGGSGAATFNGGAFGGAGASFGGLTADKISVPQSLLNGGRGGGGGGIGSQVLGALGGAGGTGGGSPLSGLFSAQGISGAIASGGITAAIALAQTALTTHSPLVGLATGGLIGLLFGNLNRGRRRRREETLRTQYLNDAVGGLSAFDDLIRDLRGLRITSDQAITQGTTLGQTLRANYLTQAGALKDKRTRETALRAVSELDFKIAQKLAELRGAADFANAAVDRKNRIIPEFAGGGFMDARFASQFSAFKRRNGHLGGTFTGRDTLPSMLAPGEMVLNPAQQSRIISAARHDIFKGKGIPGYADGGFIMPTATAPIVSAAAPTIIVQPPEITIYLNGEVFDDKATAFMASEKGERVFVKVLNKGKLNTRL